MINTLRALAAYLARRLCGMQPDRQRRAPRGHCEYCSNGLREQCPWHGPIDLGEL